MYDKKSARGSLAALVHTNACFFTRGIYYNTVRDVIRRKYSFTVPFPFHASAFVVASNLLRCTPHNNKNREPRKIGNRQKVGHAVKKREKNNKMTAENVPGVVDRESKRTQTKAQKRSVAQESCLPKTSIPSSALLQCFPLSLLLTSNIFP